MMTLEIKTAHLSAFAMIIHNLARQFCLVEKT